MNSDKPVLLVVDDTPTSVDLLHAILRDDFQIKMGLPLMLLFLAVTLVLVPVIWPL